MNREEEKEYWPKVIREIQRLSGMSLQELASEFHVSPRTIDYWKQGTRRPVGFVIVELYEFRCQLYGDKLRTVVRRI